jgi:hypothetical protein
VDHTPQIAAATPGTSTVQEMISKAPVEVSAAVMATSRSSGNIQATL